MAAELRATNLEFRTNKRLWLFGPTSSVPRADIRYLEYREDRSVEFGNTQGLYAKLKFDEQQVGTAIEAIYRRFPDMPAENPKSAFGSHFTSLGL
jgi:hypothetical protein